MSLDALRDSGAYAARGTLPAMIATDATIAITAVSVDDDVYVLIAGNRQRIGPCRWMPRVDDGGTVVLPARLDPCVVNVSSRGHHHLVWWAPAP